MELIGRLRRAGAAKLRRAVGGEGDQRDPRVVGLEDRGMEVGGGGARSAEHGRGAARRFGQSQGEEGAGAFVQRHVGADARAVQRGRERGGARSGGDDRFAHARVGQRGHEPLRPAEIERAGLFRDGIRD